jgi:protein ImuB
LFSSLDAWASAIGKELQAECFTASIVVGFTRFGSYAVARAVRGVTVLRDRDEEETKARGVSLSRLDIPPDTQVALLKLGVRTVANLLRLPAKELSKRFGTKIFDLHRLATGDLFAPLNPETAEEPLLRSMELPSPETSSERLVFFVKQLVDDLLKEIYQKSQALTRLHLILELDDQSKRKESLRPDEATLNGPLLLRLVRLRLETLHLDSGPIFLTIEAEAVHRAQEQLSLIVEKPKRDPRIRSLAFSRLRATLGEAAIVRAELTNGHLPSARFQWTPLETLPKGDASFKDGTRSLVRRIYEKPLALPHRSRHKPDQWMLRGLEFGLARDFLGPYILSGGWWRRTVQREYYFVKMQQGDVFWIFYDRVRRRWFLEGSVE